MERLADKAVRRARRRLRKAHPNLVEHVFSYGAVDIDPKHLVVWVILKGAPEAIPAWFFPSGDPGVDEPRAQGLLPQITSCAAVVREELARVNWPDAGRADVGFDSDERVAQQGGWHYLK